MKTIQQKKLESIFNLTGRGENKEEIARGLGEAIILNISIKGGQLIKGGD